MADFIGPYVTATINVLKARTPGLLRTANLTPFVDFGWAYTGVNVNGGIWVEPVRTEFDDEGNDRHQLHTVKIKFAVTGGTPDELAQHAALYMKAIDDALAAAALMDFGPNTMRLFVQSHDYGPLYECNGSYARFPEMHILLEVREL